jgi:hypothetical protein
MLRLRRGFRVLSMAAAVAALGSVALPASPASAAVPGLLYLSAETNFDSAVYKSVRAFCPSGTQVVGGGYQLVGAEGAVVLDDFIPEENNLLVGAGEIVGPGERSDGTTASWKVVANVVCASTLPGYSIQVSSSGLTNRRDNFARIACPPGRALIGGGESLSNGFGQVSTYDLSITPENVTAAAVTDVDGYSGNWSVTAYAICAASAPAGWQQVTQTSANNTQLSKSTTAFCPPGQTVIGAGWNGFTVNNADRYVTRATVSDSPDPSVTAAATAVRDNGVIWPMQARAVCVNLA